jgi:hypothetical protein
MKRQRVTFRQILEGSRAEAATSAWERAKVASRLRHRLALLGNEPAARLMSEIKTRALDRLVEILPDQVRVTIDDDFHIGLLSIRWPGHGRLHLPAGSLSNRIA